MADDPKKNPPVQGQLAASYSDTQEEVPAGRVVSVDLEGVDGAVTARIGNQEIPVRLVEGRAFFMAPLLPAGDYRLVLEAAGEAVELPLSIVKPMLPVNPRSYLE